MRRDPRIPPADIEQAAADIASDIEAKTLEDFLRDGRTQAAVERKFETV